MPCIYPGCCEPAKEKGTMCYMHDKRRARGQPMDSPRREQLTPWARVVEAAIELADADSDDDDEFRRLESHLRVATKRWAGSR
jgi:alkylated DNA nucleotide flippase Atl1